jgi:NAD(P)-dependent dehydrogenase (short-subunit alcohol dehydrogenase family)
MSKTHEHSGRMAVVTGGSGGIGGAISKRLIAEGALPFSVAPVVFNHPASVVVQKSAI